jgi:hypothetical protein
LSSTTFTDFVTPITAAWLNDVNSSVFEAVVNADGTLGAGGNDDVAIQAILNTSAKVVRFRPGYTYLINTTLTSAVAGRTIIAHGATLKLKNSASSTRILTLTADNQKVIGGDWDGNKANNSTGDQYSCWAIAIQGVDHCEITQTNIYDFRSPGIKGFDCSYANIHHNRIRNIGLAPATSCYAVYLESNSALHYGNKVCYNNIDMSTNGTSAQPILLTSVGANYQLGWKIIGNDIQGSTDVANADLAICIGARGHRGIVSLNVTTGGSMGFSEGGDDCTITGNNFSELAGTTRWGIEPTGARCVITGNTITDCIIGISSSTATMDQMTLGNNTIVCDFAVANNIGIQLQVPSGAFTGKDISITGGSITARRGVITTRDVSGLIISGVVFRGPGSGNVGSRGVFLDSPATAAHVHIMGCVFAGYERAYAVYNGAAVTHTNLYALGNIKANDIGANTSGWITEGSATLGSGTVVDAWGVAGTTGRYHIIDQSNNVRLLLGIAGTPESVETAGIGSLALRRDGGAGTIVYAKNSGTGNTGWGAIT